jgi:hypothetical protein
VAFSTWNNNVLMLIMNKIEFTEKFGPGKCWKCGVKISSIDVVYEAEGMAGRPSFTKVDYGVYPATPQFCKKCYDNFDN